MKDESSRDREDTGSARDSPIMDDGNAEGTSKDPKDVSGSSSRNKTDAEKRFEEVQKRRVSIVGFIVGITFGS